MQSHKNTPDPEQHRKTKRKKKKYTEIKKGKIDIKMEKVIEMKEKLKKIVT